MKITPLFLFMLATSCASTPYSSKVSKLEIQRFMGDWYVLAGRFTFLEKNVHNGIERYTWNERENRIDVDFTYNRGSLDGKQISLPQKAWIENTETNAHWKVSPLWPLKFDYLVIDLAEDYSWTAIGVPNQNYLWIMARSPLNAEATIQEALKRLQDKNYRTDDLVRVPHNLK